MEENNLKEEISKSLNSLDEVKTCFAVFSNGKQNNVCVGGYGEDIINSLANMFKKSPAILNLIKEATEVLVQQSRQNIVEKLINNPFETCSKEDACPEELKEIMRNFLQGMSKMTKN